MDSDRKELREILEKVEEAKEEENKLFTAIKRVYIFIIALVLIILLLVNTNMGYHLISLASGRIVSSDFNDYTFALKHGGTVHFDILTWDALSRLYDANQQHEFKACLIGYRSDNDYYITGMYEPTIYAQDVYSVTSQVCDNNTIVSLHSHPPLHCIFSDQDVRSYEIFRQINPDGIIGLMCKEDRITFYGY